MEMKKDLVYFPFKATTAASMTKFNFIFTSATLRNVPNP